MVGATVTETAQLLGISRGTVSKVMTAYEKKGKTRSAEHKSGRSSSLSERDRRTLNRIVRKNNKTTVSKIMAKLLEHLERSIFIKTVCRELHKSEFYERAAIKKSFCSHRLTLLKAWSGAKELKIGPSNSRKM